jgi:hypothetical protein
MKMSFRSSSLSSDSRSSAAFRGDSDGVRNRQLPEHCLSARTVLDQYIEFAEL